MEWMFGQNEQKERLMSFYRICRNNEYINNLIDRINRCVYQSIKQLFCHKLYCIWNNDNSWLAFSSDINEEYSNWDRVGVSTETLLKTVFSQTSGVL